MGVIHAIQAANSCQQKVSTLMLYCMTWYFSIEQQSFKNKKILDNICDPPFWPVKGEELRMWFLNYKIPNSTKKILAFLISFCFPSRISWLCAKTGDIGNWWRGVQILLKYCTDVPLPFTLEWTSSNISTLYFASQYHNSTSAVPISSFKNVHCHWHVVYCI